MEAQGRLGRACAPTRSRRRKVVWLPEQKEALEAAFRQNPYAGIAVREHLAAELAVPESRIHVWFQNRRRRENPRGSGARNPRGCCAEGRRRMAPEPGKWAARGGAQEGSRPRTCISAPQLRILTEAFQTQRRPTFAVREELARKTGLPEDRIQVWFQNRRARHPEQSGACPGAPFPAAGPATGGSQDPGGGAAHSPAASASLGRPTSSEPFPPQRVQPWAAGTSGRSPRSQAAASTKTLCAHSAPAAPPQGAAGPHFFPAQAPMRLPLSSAPGPAAHAERRGPSRAPCQPEAPAPPDPAPAPLDTLQQQPPPRPGTQLAAPQGGSPGWRPPGQLLPSGQHLLAPVQPSALDAGQPALPAPDTPLWDLLEQLLSGPGSFQQPSALLQEGEGEGEGEEELPAPEPPLTPDEFQALLHML